MTNKKDHTAQIAAHERRQRLLHDMEANISPAGSTAASKVIDDEKLGDSDPNAHYHIAKSQKFHEDIYCFADDESNDPATFVSLIFFLFSFFTKPRTLPSI